MSSLSLRIMSATSPMDSSDGRLEPARMYARAARFCTTRFNVAARCSPSLIEDSTPATCAFSPANALSADM